MTDLVGAAGAALAPWLTAGGGAVAAKMVEDLGKDAAGVVERVIAKLRPRLRSDAPSRAQIEAALTDAVAAGDVSESDLTVVLSSQAANTNVNRNRGSTTNIGTVSAGNAIFDSHFDVAGDLNFHPK